MLRPALSQGWPALAATLAAGLFGCNQSVPCRATVTPLAQADGGAVSCIASADCPRTDNRLVCQSNAAPATPCVRCANNVCENVDGQGCP